MKYNELSKSNYETQRYNVLLNVEETGVAQLQPYVDSKGIATIGVGFNLKVEDVRNQVLVNFRLGENVNENPKLLETQINQRGQSKLISPFPFLFNQSKGSDQKNKGSVIAHPQTKNKGSNKGTDTNASNQRGQQPKGSE
jgi:hypothetical protein